MMTFIPLARVAVWTFCAGMRVAKSSRAGKHRMGLKYHRVTNMRRFVVLFALLSTAMCAQDSRDVVNRGVAAFKSGNYPQAVEFFQQAVALDPNAVNPHLYLGTAYMSAWRPSDGMDVIAQRANVEFRRVLELDPINQTALASLASMAYNTAISGEAKAPKLDE